VRGSRYETVAGDINGITIPGQRAPSRGSCVSCHGERPMHDEKLNDHTDIVACQTCHIPTIARGGYATKTYWDWSTSGQLDADGNPILKKDELGNVIYSSQKGDSVWEENLVPEYIWSNGTAEYTLLGDIIDPAGIVPINRFLGGPDDPQSRIWPVKRSRGKQPYDAGNDTLVAVNIFALHRFANDSDAYWRNLDWQPAIARGMSAVGMEFSGNVGFVETEMLWPVTHMVAPAKGALSCESCHARDGRLADIDGVYIPSRDRNQLLDLFGFALIGLTAAGGLFHGFMRVLLRVLRRNQP